MSGAAWLAVFTSLACVLAVIAIAVMVGMLPPEDLAQLGILAE